MNLKRGYFTDIQKYFVYKGLVGSSRTFESCCFVPFTRARLFIKYASSLIKNTKQIVEVTLCSDTLISFERTRSKLSQTSNP